MSEVLPRKNNKLNKKQKKSIGKGSDQKFFFCKFVNRFSSPKPVWPNKS